MLVALRAIHWLISIALVGVVILQPGRSAGLGMISGGAEAFLGRRKKGLDQLLSKITVYLAVGFMINSIALTILRR